MRPIKFVWATLFLLAMLDNTKIQTSVFNIALGRRGEKFTYSITPLEIIIIIIIIITTIIIIIIMMIKVTPEFDS